MRCPSMLWLVLLLSACADPDAATGGNTGSSGQVEGESTEADTTGDTPATSVSGTASAATTSSSSSSSSSSTSSTSSTGTDPSASTESAGSSEGPACPVGTLDCPCDGEGCSDGLACTDGLCEPPAVCDEDLLEPNDEESMPTLLGEISDDDDDGGSIFGTLDGPDDVDWYQYNGNDNLLSNVDPARFVQANGGVRLCKFAECEGGVDDTEFDCPAETLATTSPLGRPGCCAPMGIVLGDANCTGVLEDNMQVFMRVDQAQDACVDYELIYHF